MNENNYKNVYSAENMLFAVTVQAGLEKAGIPSRVRASNNGGYLHVEVPAQLHDAALDLLFVEPRTGEIYYALAY